MTILDIYTALQQQLKPIGLNIYKEVKPTSEKNNCIVLNSVPISKNNVNTVNDMIIFLYLNKISGTFDFFKAQSLFPQISSSIKDVIIGSSIVTLTEKLDPNTINIDDSWTASEFSFRLITH